MPGGAAPERTGRCPGVASGAFMAVSPGLDSLSVLTGYLLLGKQAIPCQCIAGMWAGVAIIPIRGYRVHPVLGCYLLSCSALPSARAGA